MKAEHHSVKPMNIKDLKPGSYKVITPPGKLNINNLPDPHTDPDGYIQNRLNTPKPTTNHFFADPKNLEAITAGTTQGIAGNLGGGLKDVAKSFSGAVDNTVKNIGGQYMDSAKNIMQNESDKQTGKQSKPLANLDTAAQLTKAIFAPITEPISAIAQKAGEGLSNNKTFSKVANSGAGDQVAKAQQAFQQLKESHPVAAKAFENAFTVAMGLTAGGEAPEGDIKTGITDTVKSGVDTIKKVGDSFKPSPEDLIAKQTAKAEALKANALKDVTPDYETATPTQKAKMVANGEVQEGGMTKGRTLTSNPLHESAAEELSKLPGYDSAKTFLEKHRLAKQAFTDEAKNLETKLGDKKIVVPKRTMVKQIGSAIKQAADESLLIAKSDPVVDNFMRVVGRASSRVEGTLKGALDLKKQITSAYRNARGKLAFNSDKIAPLDDLNRAANNALKQFLIDHAPDAETEASFKRQFDLATAMENLVPKAVKEGGSSVERFIKKHPLVTKGAKTVGRYTGLGEVIKHIP